MIWMFLVGGVLTAIVIAIARAGARRRTSPAAADGRDAGSADVYSSNSDGGSVFWSSTDSGSSDDGSRWSGGDSANCDASSSSDSSSSDCGGGDSGSSSSD